MRALILNSGMGTRMGSLTQELPKCMTQIDGEDTILSRQLRLLKEAGIQNVIITTGSFDRKIQEYCDSLSQDLKYIFRKNNRYFETNYIYSIYCARDLLEDDLILLHGDMVFSPDVLQKITDSSISVMAVSLSSPLPEKDFKAVLNESEVCKIGVEFFENAVAAQPLYKFLREDWLVWLREIESFCESGRVTCYAEVAFNEVAQKCRLSALDVRDDLCAEIDTAEDLERIRQVLWKGTGK